MDGSISIESIRLTPAENGLVLSWSEHHNYPSNSMSSYKDKQKVFTNSDKDKVAAVNAMVKLNKIKQNNPYDATTYKDKMKGY